MSSVIQVIHHSLPQSRVHVNIIAIPAFLWYPFQLGGEIAFSVIEDGRSCPSHQSL